jgi:hypothetical protein
MPKVRTRMQPDVVIDVPDDEYEVLRSAGLLAADPAPAAKAPAAVQPATAAPKTTDAPSPAADTTTTKKG